MFTKVLVNTFKKRLFGCNLQEVTVGGVWFQVVSVIEKRADELDYVLVDTPGQIEIFTWSASGAIITEAFASTFPTVIAYVVDTPRSTNPVTFMSNMLYACSILYKTRLPMVLVFNKTDVAQHQFALEVQIAIKQALLSFFLFEIVVIIRTCFRWVAHDFVFLSEL